VFASLSSAPPGLRQAGIYAALEPGYRVLMTECLPNWPYPGRSHVGDCI